MEFGSTARGLILVIDNGNGERRGTRKLLSSLGFDVVQASTGLAGLELIQRLPESFQLVLTNLTLPGLPGPIVVETLRLFRPDLPVLCMTEPHAGVPAGSPQRCLAKPLQAEELRMRIERALSGAVEWDPETHPLAAEAVVRARERYEAGNGLVEAALELARGA